MILCLAGLGFAQSPVIKAGDTVQLICAEEASINRDYRVTSDGLILVDFLGAVKIVDLTEQQAADKIAKQLLDEKILKKATVSLKLINPNVEMVKFSGAVKVGAETPWRPNLKLSDIIRLAEVLPDTDVSRIQIKSESGAVQIVDTTKGEDPLLKPGDEITFFVKAGTQPTNPKDPPVDPQVPVQPSNTSQVAVKGKVTLPGNYDFSQNMTVRELLIKCGGFLEGADLNSISLERSGAKRTLRLPSDNDFILQAGDLITVDERSRPKLFVTVDGSVKRPGQYEIEEGTKLSEVIKMAGGFNEGARTDRIKIYSTGNEKPREIKFEEIELGYRGDILLQPAQTIEVPGPRVEATLPFGPKTRSVVGALAFLFLIGS